MWALSKNTKLLHFIKATTIIYTILIEQEKKIKRTFQLMQKHIDNIK
jgi:hypothetical protein